MGLQSVEHDWAINTYVHPLLGQESWCFLGGSTQKGSSRVLRNGPWSAPQKEDRAFKSRKWAQKGLKNPWSKDLSSLPSSRGVEEGRLLSLFLCKGLNSSSGFDSYWDKEVVVHIYNGILLSHKKEHIWVSSNEVNEPRTYYTAWSKSKREKQIWYINVYIWNLERWYWRTYLQGSSGDADRE